MSISEQSHRDFLYKTSFLAASFPLLQFNSFAGLPGLPEVVENTPRSILTDKRLKLKFGKKRMVLNDGLQPSMLATSAGTLIVQSQNSKKPYPQERIFYPYAMSIASLGGLD
ncbi:MAG: hypothetical protein H7069_12040 [Phormidesmis sp. FL-bin-119]|nr:hypothetical protein [Pedobacter sp.]